MRKPIGLTLDFLDTQQQKEQTPKVQQFQVNRSKKSTPSKNFVAKYQKINNNMILTFPNNLNPSNHNKLNQREIKKKNHPLNKKKKIHRYSIWFSKSFTNPPQRNQKNKKHQIFKSHLHRPIKIILNSASHKKGFLDVQI